MVQPIIPNQEIPLVPPQEFLGRPQLDHVLTRDIESYHTLVKFIKVDG